MSTRFAWRSRLRTPYRSRLDADLGRIGGSYRWYGLIYTWRVRALFGRLTGEYWRLDSPAELVPAPPLTGGLSFGVIRASSCYAPSGGFPEKLGLGIGAVRENSYRSDHSARRESPVSSLGSCSNLCIDVSSRRLRRRIVRAS